jgi:hypothetical protein
VLAASATDIAVVSLLASSGILMQPLEWRVLAALLTAATSFALILDQIKQPLMSALKIE